MQLVYGTTNAAKLQHMKEMTADLDFDILDLAQAAGRELPEVEENGKEPVENARQKALAYYRLLGRPVFSCDSGLFLEGLSSDQQPGTEIRRVKGRRLTDEQMIAHYAAIAASAGGEIQAQYLNSICLVLDENRVYSHQGPDISTPSFLLVAQAHPQRLPGLPLDSISITPDSRQYFVVLRHQDNANDVSMAAGFCRFFAQNLGHRRAESELEKEAQE